MFYKLDDFTIYCTDNCNLNCIYCKSKKPTTQKFNKTQDEVITISGGEPMLSPQFDKIMDMCRNNFNDINLLSNLTLLDKQKLESILSLKTTVLTNIDTFDKELYESITQSETFDDKLNNMDLIYSHINELKSFIISMVITQDSLPHLVKNVKYILERWPNANILFRCLDFNEMDYLTARRLGVSFRRIDGELRAVRNLTLKFQTLMLPFCWAVQHEKQCIEYHIIDSIYRDRKKLVQNFKIYKNDFPGNIYVHGCAKCIHRKYCPGIHSMYVRIFGEQEFPGVDGYELFSKDSIL